MLNNVTPAGGRSFGRALRLAAVFAAAAWLAGCAGDEPEKYVERSVGDIYNSAMDKMLSGDHGGAAREFEEVERQHPYSIWATKAQLMSAFARYQRDDYDLAILAAERFISLHPGNDDIPYAYYLIGLSYYEQISDVGRDQKMTKLALENFQELTARFPKSKYSRDAQLKIDLALDHLAGKEMEIGRTYQGLEFYVAAIGRFRTVVAQYQTTSHVAEALLRLTECYLALGISDEAQMTAAVLGHNFPGSDWYEDAYAMLQAEALEPRLNDRSWLAEIF